MAIGIAAIGGYSTWRWGERKFHEGMVYALCNHHNGDLKYKVYEDEDGQDVLEITINGS